MAIETNRPLTYDDYAALPDDGKRYELIAGRLHELTAPTLTHQDLVGGLFARLWSFLEGHAAGKVLVAPFDVLLDRYNVLQPDILFVAADNPVLGEKFVQGAPDLVVEVLSPATSRRDLGRKRELYEEHGVKEYWVVHADQVLVRIFARMPSGKFARPRPYGVRGTVRSPLLPGFELRVADLYRLREA
ncbi:MAG: Uma2 family endonuclease [Candidatus Sericytochromatia bacterium]|nr:Uma2 family endonuclease [Candidatus Tanganyikabacteria bacterium]